MEHNIIYGQELISNHYVYLISEKDSNFIFDVNIDNIEKIYPFKTYRFEIEKAPQYIAMWFAYPRINGFGIERDGENYVTIW